MQTQTHTHMHYLSPLVSGIEPHHSTVKQPARFYVTHPIRLCISPTTESLRLRFILQHSSSLLSLAPLPPLPPSFPSDLLLLSRPFRFNHVFPIQCATSGDGSPGAKSAALLKGPLTGVGHAEFVRSLPRREPSTSSWYGPVQLLSRQPERLRSHHYVLCWICFMHMSMERFLYVLRRSASAFGCPCGDAQRGKWLNAIVHKEDCFQR